MSITKDKMKWDCVSNHLPDWVEDNDIILHGLLSKSEYNSVMKLIDRYNEITIAENQIDPFQQYGMEDEKQDIINELIKIYEKYKEKINQ